MGSFLLDRVKLITAGLGPMPMVGKSILISSPRVAVGLVSDAGRNYRVARAA